MSGGVASLLSSVCSCVCAVCALPAGSESSSLANLAIKSLIWLASCCRLPMRGNMLPSHIQVVCSQNKTKQNKDTDPEPFSSASSGAVFAPIYVWLGLLYASLAWLMRLCTNRGWGRGNNGNPIRFDLRLLWGLVSLMRILCFCCILFLIFYPDRSRQIVCRTVIFKWLMPYELN